MEPKFNQSENVSADVLSALSTATPKGSILKEVDPIYEIISTISENRPSFNVPTAELNKNGIAIQDSFEKYLGHPGIQSSNFKQALLTPFHYLYSREEDKAELRKVMEEKKHFQLGTFIHQCILEPSKFKRVVIEPKTSMASTEGVNTAIGWWEKLLLEYHEDGTELINKSMQLMIDSGLNLDKIDGKKAYLESLKSKTDIQPVSEEHYLKISIVKKHLDNYGNGIVYKILRGSKREISFYYQDENGLQLKVRPDSLQFEENIGVNAIISVKSTACADLRAFISQNAALHYDLSEAMYQDVISKVTGRKFDTTITIMLQTIEPFAIAVLVWNKDDISVGKYKYESAKLTVLSAIEKNEFKGYDNFADNESGLILMKLPDWNNRELLPSN